MSRLNVVRLMTCCGFLLLFSRINSMLNNQDTNIPGHFFSMGKMISTAGKMLSMDR